MESTHFMTPTPNAGQSLSINHWYYVTEWVTRIWVATSSLVTLRSGWSSSKSDSCVSYYVHDLIMVHTMIIKRGSSVHCHELNNRHRVRGVNSKMWPEKTRVHKTLNWREKNANVFRNLSPLHFSCVLWMLCHNNYCPACTLYWYFRRESLVLFSRMDLHVLKQVFIELNVTENETCCC